MILGPFQEVSLPFLGRFPLLWAAWPLTFLWLVGMTNAFNFMDGIDGIAAGQSVVAGAGWMILGERLDCPMAALWGALLAGTCLGFLGHNAPPARVFMGDVGSAYL